MSWPNIFILFFAILCLVYRRRASFYVSFALVAIVWNAIANFGININASKILVGVFLVTYGISGYLYCRKRVPLSSILYLVLFHSLFCSVIAVAYVQPGSEVTALQYSVFQRFPVRGFIATAYWIMNISYFALGLFCFESRKHLVKCLNTYLLTCYVVAILAAVQVGSYYLFPPLERLLAFFSSGGSRQVATAVTTITGFYIYRPSLFCAESRYLGLAMALASAIVIVGKLVIVPGMNQRLISADKLLLYMVIMLASASTSVLAGFASGVVVLWVCISRCAEGHSLTYMFRKWQIIAVIALLVMCFTWVEYKTRYMSHRFNYYFSAMGIMGNEKSEMSDGSNIACTAYLRAMVDNPFKSVLGFGVGNVGFFAYEYLDPMSPDYRDGTILSSRFPLIDLLAGIGILGIGYIIILWRRWLLYIKYHSLRMREPSLLFLYYL